MNAMGKTERERVREGETDRHIQRQRETERERGRFSIERFDSSGTKATSSVYSKTDAWNALRIRMHGLSSAPKFLRLNFEKNC